MTSGFQTAAVVFVLLLGTAFLFGIVLRHIALSVRVLAAGYVAIGALGTFAYRPSYATAEGVDRTIIAYYHEQSALTVFSFFAVIGLSCALGGAAARLIVSSPSAVDDNAEGANPTLRLSGSALWAAVFAVALRVYGVGPHTLLRSDVYLAHSGPNSVLILSSAAVPLGVVIAANVLLGGRASGAAKTIAASVLGVNALMALGEDTRTLALIPALIFIGGALSGRWNTKRATAWGVVSAAACIVLLGVPLYLRSQEMHGIIPALQYFKASPASFFSNNANPFQNVLLGVPLTLYVGHAVNPIPIHDLITSVNPLPGSLTPWPRIAPGLRLNAFQPYSGLGELRNYGWGPLLCYSFGLGLVLGVLEGITLKRSAAMRAPLRALIVITAGIVMIRSTEYNLRAETRLVYYAIVLVVAAVVVDAAGLRARLGEAPAPRRGHAPPTWASRTRGLKGYVGASE